MFGNVFVMAKAFMPALSTLFPNSVCFMRRVEKSWVPLSAIWGRKHTSSIWHHFASWCWPLKLDQARAGWRRLEAGGGRPYCLRVSAGGTAVSIVRPARAGRYSTNGVGAAAAAAVEIYIHHPQGWSLCLHLTLHQRKMESFCRNAIFGEFYLRSVKSFTASRKLF